jgi:SAM-dependent methyltransferase
MPENYFGEDVAARYDDPSDSMFARSAIAPVVDLLAELAGGGDALELGIGTGRIAVPLSERGVHVHGIDLSEAMVARLRAKPGADAIGVTIGDFSTTRVDGTFTVAYLVYNTINNLTTQDAQVACFQNVGAHLAPGGHFVIEVGVPGLQRLPPGQTAVPFTVTPDRLGFDEYDVVDQGMISHHYWRSADGGFDSLSVPFRYVWPSELDLMGRLTGFRLRDRWAGWDRAPFSPGSQHQVAVFERLAG